jgi:hypothetical protein
MKTLPLLVVPAAVAAFAAIPVSASFAGGGSQHAAITITSDADFVSGRCITAGSGGS